MKRSNIKHYKSTFLGTVFISTGIYLLIQNITIDYTIIGGLFLSGVCLWFSPDKYINIVEQFIKNKTENKETKENG